MVHGGHLLQRAENETDWYKSQLCKTQGSMYDSVTKTEENVAKN